MDFTGDKSPKVEQRPNAVFIRGVGQLSTSDIKHYLDAHLKEGYTFSTRHLFEDFKYRLQWVNDESVVINFPSNEGALKALRLLSTQDLPLHEERVALPYQHKSKDDGRDTGDDQVVLYIRQARTDDKKEFNAKEKSRYYLLHGEPEFSSRAKKGAYRERNSAVPKPIRTTEDLITGELVTGRDQEIRRSDANMLFRRLGSSKAVKIRNEKDLFPQYTKRSQIVPDDEEDLFPQYLRDRSPKR
ncbi:BA75_02323T0 [Komagataella pastoris]|uniref:BA75_02323T0 n=1 Tax=Komagataella pastoris TaxID=4922 RepID=A0A1B2JDA5_PICPA|nr:BA75_02323T0 [Komagataella pastoris]